MEVELQALANHSGAPPLDVAMAQAQSGDPLELDLLMSGWYDNSDMGDSVGSDARHDVAQRSLGDLLARIREAAITRRWGTDENTLLNMAMRHGHHYVEVDRARRAVVERPAPRNAVRRTVQKFEPWFRQHHGRLAAGKPRYTLKPSSRQQTDRDAATFAKKLAGWLAPILFPFRFRAELSQWKLLAGKVVYFLGVKWVPDDEYMVDPATGEPVLRPELDPAILPPQVCWCDDRIPHVEDMRWFGRDVHVPMPEAIASYPDHAERLMPVSVLTNYGHHVLRRVQRFTGVEDPWGGSVEGGAGALAVDEEEETTIPEFYLRPGATLACGFLDWLDPEALGAPVEVIRASDEGKGIAVVRFPEGLKACFTPDGTVLRTEANFYGTLPFVSMSFSKSPGFWCVAPATPMRSLQIAFNWVFSMREAHAIKTGNAPLMQPREARISRRGGLTNAFARILYRANRFGAKPEYLSPPQIGVDVAALQTALEMAWQDIGGIHEVSQAKLPSADLSGVTVSLLQEQDLAQLGYAGEEQETAYAEILRMALLFIQQFFPSQDPRLLQLSGDALYMLLAFMEADLRHGLDVRCEEGSAVPLSPAATEAKARDAWQMGFMVDSLGRPDYRRMQSIFGFGSEDDLYGEEELDVENARRVEDAILTLRDAQLAAVVSFIQTTGTLPQSLLPRPEDDPFVHEREHRQRLKRAQADPRVQPLAVEILRMRWQAIATTIAPLLAQTEPAVALAAAGGAGGAEQAPPDEGGKKEPAAQAA